MSAVRDSHVGTAALGCPSSEARQVFVITTRPPTERRHVPTRPTRTPPRPGRSHRPPRLHRRSLRRSSRKINRRLPPLYRPTRLPYELLDGLRTPPHPRPAPALPATLLRKFSSHSIRSRRKRMESPEKKFRHPALPLHRAIQIRTCRTKPPNRIHASRRRQARRHTRCRNLANDRPQQLPHRPNRTNPPRPQRLAPASRRRRLVSV